MKTSLRIFLLSALSVIPALAAPMVHVDVFGEFLGGRDGKKGKYAELECSGSRYSVWKPEVTPILNGGVFVSLRVDHLRGFFASNDYASLQVSFRADGSVELARSSIALQGRRITSDLIADSGKLGAKAVGLGRTARVGAEMVANLSAKVLRENVREPGRVTFPAVLNHHYNLLCMAVGDLNKLKEQQAEAAEKVKAAPVPLEITKPNS